MINYSQSTVFNTSMQTIVNPVNCVGVMGKGLALDFRLRYSKMYEDYTLACKEKKVKVGIPYIYSGYLNQLILNFPTKSDWKHPSKIEWIEKGLIYFVENYQKENILSIAFPKLGTDNGGLKWQVVKPLMENYLNKVSIPVTLCLNEEKFATGTEGQMVSIINNMTENELIQKVGIIKKTAEKLVINSPYKRFYEISYSKVVSQQAYEKIYRYCYEQTK